MGPEQLFRELSVNWRDDCIVIEEVKVLAILVDNYDPQWAQMVVLGIGHHVVGLGGKQLNAPIALNVLAGAEPVGFAIHVLNATPEQCFGQVSYRQNRHSFTRVPLPPSMGLLDVFVYVAQL